MKKFIARISHHLFATEKNGGIPHILRVDSFLALVAVSVGALYISTVGFHTVIQKFDLAATVYPSVLIDMANKSRADTDLPPLQQNALLQQAAALKAHDMAINGYFAHTSPQGLTPWHWMRQAGYSFVYAGENLAVHYDQSENVEDAWLASPSHRANILNANYTQIGIATETAQFEGVPTTFVVEMFGVPATLHAAQTQEKPHSAISTAAPSVAAEKNRPVQQAEVAGAETTAAEEQTLETLHETPQLIEVHNTDTAIVPQTVSPGPSQRQSRWYERILFNPVPALSALYSILILIIFIAMTSLVAREYRKHHFMHLALGCTAIFIIGACAGTASGVFHVLLVTH